MNAAKLVRVEHARLGIDFRTYFPGLKNWRRLPLKLALAVIYPRFGAVYFHRMNRSFRLRGWNKLAYAFYLTNYYLNHVDISPLSDIGSAVEFSHPIGIVIGGSSSIGRRTKVFSCVTLGTNSVWIPDSGFPKVGHDCFIGTGAKLIGAITIGNRATIGANSVVIRDVPAGSVAAGVPAKILRS